MSHRDNETIRMSDFSPISEKSKYYKVEEHEIPAQSKTFAAACFAFRDNLTRVQKSKARGTAVESESESDTSGTEDAYQQEASQAAKVHANNPASAHLNVVGCDRCVAAHDLYLLRAYEKRRRSVADDTEFDTDASSDGSGSRSAVR